MAEKDVIVELKPEQLLWLVTLLDERAAGKTDEAEQELHEHLAHCYLGQNGPVKPGQDTDVPEEDLLWLKRTMALYCADYELDAVVDVAKEFYRRGFKAGAAPFLIPVPPDPKKHLDAIGESWRAR